MAELVRNGEALAFAPISPIDDDDGCHASVFAAHACGKPVNVREIHGEDLDAPFLHELDEIRDRIESEPPVGTEPQRRVLCFGEVVQHGPRGFSRHVPRNGGQAEDLLDREVAFEQMKHSRFDLRFLAFAGQALSSDGAAKCEETDIRIVGLFAPDEAREVFLDILREYQEGELTPKGRPRRKGFVEAIESIRQARLETFWTDDVSRLPPPGREMWWEIWCLREFEDDREDLIERLGARVAERERRLYFPEHVVLPVLAAKATIELMLLARRVAP